MSLNSLSFFLLFAALLLVHRLLPARARPLWLLLASYAYLATWDPRLVAIIVFSTSVDFAVGLKLGAEAVELSRRSRRRWWLALSLATQLGVLGVFKYFNFFADSLAVLFARAGLSVVPLHLSFVAAIGVSFFTFKTLTYTIDLYYGRMQPCTSPVRYALYVAFFPELVAGPIDRARALLPQIMAGTVADSKMFVDGLHLLFLGLFKKVYVADNMALLVNAGFGTPDRTGLDALTTVYMYAVQIYCDFSGYTDMARGCGKCLGFELAENFRFPYLAWSPSDFWQRWHISLSTWLRDYVFAPLGGALRGLGQGYRNLLITMTVAGLWHGAAWTYMLWGVYWGVLLVGHRLLQPSLKRFRRQLRPWLPARPRRWIEVLITFHLVCAGWILFRSATLGEAGRVLGAVLQPHGLSRASSLGLFASFLLPLVALEVTQVLCKRTDIYRDTRIPAWLRVVLYSILLYFVAFHGARAQSFVYATF